MFPVLKYVLYIILFILAVIVLSGVYIFARNVYDRRYFNDLFAKPSSLSYTLPNGKEYSLDTWMSNVNPSVPINKIVIPEPTILLPMNGKEVIVSSNSSRHFGQKLSILQ